jgi:hypothetical protein
MAFNYNLDTKESTWGDGLYTACRCVICHPPYIHICWLSYTCLSLIFTTWFLEMLLTALNTRTSIEIFYPNLVAVVPCWSSIFTFICWSGKNLRPICFYKDNERASRKIHKLFFTKLFDPWQKSYSPKFTYLWEKSPMKWSEAKKKILISLPDFFYILLPNFVPVGNTDLLCLYV